MSDLSNLNAEGACSLPRHVAIIMDGNGRWAKQRFLPRAAGHSRGLETVRSVINAAVKRNIEYLSLFAFSSENWFRPAEEVSALMRLFVVALRRELGRLKTANVKLRIVGNREQFDSNLRKLIDQAEEATAANSGLQLSICASYSGRWDIIQATKAYHAVHGNMDACNDETLAPYFALNFAPDLDLMIRTGGESRISNFMLWQAAYSELYFSDALWPDFSEANFVEALEWYSLRTRRFGRVDSN